jgi:MOSC domain-containing protein YiiM
MTIPMAQLNAVQTGKVVFLGARSLREQHSIKTLSLESAIVDYNGVIGDYHSELLINEPMDVSRGIFTQDYVDSMYKAGYRLFKTAQINVLDLNLAKLMKQGNINVKPGDVGEQILVDGIDLGVLHQGTIIRIGNQVELEVVTPRLYCSRFGLDLTSFDETATNESIGSTIKRLLFAGQVADWIRYKPIGIYARVLKTGVINLSDTVVVDPTFSPYYGSKKLIIPSSQKEIHQTLFTWMTREQFVLKHPNIPLSTVDSYYAGSKL